MPLSFLKKYQPATFADYDTADKNIATLKTFIAMDYLFILIVGNNGSGRSTLVNVTIGEYYGTGSVPPNDVLFINNLSDQGIRYYRNNVKTFCQTSSSIPNKKKTLVIDDIDLINEQSQQVFRNCIDKYQTNINFIVTCVDMQKVIQNIQSRCSIIRIRSFDLASLREIYTRICKGEGDINIDEDASEFILKISNNTVRILLNYLEKIKLYGMPITMENVKDICTNISYNDFDIYTRGWYTNRDLSLAIDAIYRIHAKGYSVMDILDSYFSYVKVNEFMGEKIKYEVIKKICEYISIFHRKHEDEIELSFFTLDLTGLSSGDQGEE